MSGLAVTHAARLQSLAQWWVRLNQASHTEIRIFPIPKAPVEQFLTGPMTQEAINAAGFVFKQVLIPATQAATMVPPAFAFFAALRVICVPSSLPRRKQHAAQDQSP